MSFLKRSAMLKAAREALSLDAPLGDTDSINHVDLLTDGNDNQAEDRMNRFRDLQSAPFGLNGSAEAGRRDPEDAIRLQGRAHDASGDWRADESLA